MIGGGKYDALMTALMTATQADAIVLLAVGGTLGNGGGMSVREGKIEMHKSMPQMLRDAADRLEKSGDIERDNAALKKLEENKDKG